VTVLIAHTDTNGTSPAQSRFEAESLDEARRIFAERHPDRVITATGVLGVERSGG